MKKKFYTGIYIVSEEIAHREIEGRVLLLIPGDSQVYEFNRTGKFIWNQILKKRPFFKIVEDFAKQFSLPCKTANDDVTECIRDLVKRGILRKKSMHALYNRRYLQCKGKPEKVPTIYTKAYKKSEYLLKY